MDLTRQSAPPTWEAGHPVPTAFFKGNSFLGAPVPALRQEAHSPVATSSRILKHMATSAVALRSHTKAALRFLIPLRVRKRAAVWLGRRAWLSSREWWTAELVRDLAERDAAAYHQFLWSNHLAYAATYEVDERFGDERIHPSRRELFSDLLRVLEENGMEPARIGSVFEVGCSMGYLLRQMETDLFPAAATLEGNDIDEYAVRAGQEHLSGLGSRVRLHAGDMRDLERYFVGRRFDLILCAGVLMYLPEAEAEDVLRKMLHHSSGVVALTGLAHPATDNARLTASEQRESDRSFIHNIDRLVQRVGGRVLMRRWEGPRMVNGNTIYFVFCAP